MCQTWSVSLFRENIAILNHTKTVQMLFRLWLNIPKNGQAELVFKGRDALPRCWRMCVSTRGTLLKHGRDSSLVPHAMLFLSPRKLLTHSFRKDSLTT